MVNRATQDRLRFIDFLLDHYGTLNRAAIADFYGLSTVQASNDIRAYIEAAPGNIAYDMSAKAYRRSENFSRAFE